MSESSRKWNRVSSNETQLTQSSSRPSTASLRLLPCQPPILRLSSVRQGILQRNYIATQSTVGGWRGERAGKCDNSPQRTRCIQPVAVIYPSCLLTYRVTQDKVAKQLDDRFCCKLSHVSRVVHCVFDDEVSDAIDGVKMRDAT